MAHSILNTLSLSRKAGFLKMGFDPVWESIGKGAVLIMYTQDISPKTKERMDFQAEKFNVKSCILPHDAIDVDYVIGKRTAVLSLTNKDFKEKVLKSIEA